MTEFYIEYDRSAIFEKVGVESLMEGKLGTPRALFNLLNSKVMKEYPGARILGEAPLVLTNRAIGRSTLVVHYEVEPKSGYGVSFKVPLIPSERRPGRYLVTYGEREEDDGQL